MVRLGALLALIAGLAVSAGHAPTAISASPPAPGENFVTKVQPRISFKGLVTKGVAVSASSDVPVTVRAAIYARGGRGILRRIAFQEVTTPALRQGFRLRPSRRWLGPNRSFCIRYRVALRAGDGSGGAAGGCVSVIGRNR